MVSDEFQVNDLLLIVVTESNLFHEMIISQI